MNRMTLQLALGAVFLIAAGGVAAETAGQPAVATQQDADRAGACESIAAARAQLAEVLQRLQNQTTTDLGALRTELTQIQQQALARDEALAAAQRRLDACAETEAGLRQQIATLTAQRDELARTVSRLQAAATETTTPATPPTTEAPPAPTSDDILTTARQWAEAWSAGDAELYLSFYDENFRPPAGQNRAAWEAQRHQRLKAAGQIRVEIQNPEVRLDAPDTATLGFTQHYRSARYGDVTRKRLVLRLRDGVWRIVEEHATPAK